ncbi:MAG: TerC family protein [Thermodesulfobacteriota bacterium]
MIAWTAFNAFVIMMLIIDLGLFSRRAHAFTMREALIWSAVWVTLALCFCGGILYWKGAGSALDFLTGYVLEKSLSMDNIFVFLLIFTYFGVPAKYQHRVLMWGIIGALIMRAAFIFAGIALIEKFHWTLYVMGVFLVYTGIKMGVQRDGELQPEKNPLLRLCYRVLPMTDRLDKGRFFVKQKKKTYATPLLLVLVLVETSDIMFAFDSIPAILSITRDPFIVYTSNVFAILGLRALYFALAHLHKTFRYLHYGLAVILVFVGVKMLIADWYKIPVWSALLTVAVILVISIIASKLIPSANHGEQEASRTTGRNSSSTPKKLPRTKDKTK